MDWMYLVYFVLGMLIFFGARGSGKGGWNGESTSLKQTRALQGIAALGVAFHHLAQKTCAPWLPYGQIVHGLEFFLPLGYLFVAVFFFCSGLGLYKSLHTKPDYLGTFFRRRILPVVIAFYLSEWIYTAVRLLTGERMDFVRILWYLSGLHMANEYSWYVIVIPFFYLAFWAAFRFCRKEGVSILLVFLFTAAYTVFGASLNHQDDWWMRGEWWYNSVILFPLGLLFARFEQPLSRFFRRGYWFWLLLSASLACLLFLLSEYLVDERWGYYGTVQNRLLSTGIQWISGTAFVAFFFMLTMKVKIGNRALGWLGGMSLEFYLMHGMFVELFSRQFLDSPRSLYYIRSVPLYSLVVLACTVPAALAFRLLRNKVQNLFPGLRTGRGAETGKVPLQEAEQARLRKEKAAKAWRIAKALFFPALFAAFSLVIFVGFRKNGTLTVSGITVNPPSGFERTSSDNRQTIWKYTKDDKKPGVLILDREIKGERAQRYTDIDTVLKESFWLEEAELYVNPDGIRTARGFCTEFSGYPERRYYVETDGAVFLLCMIEDTRYYNPEDCEEAMLQTVDGMRKK